MYLQRNQKKHSGNERRNRETDKRYHSTQWRNTRKQVLKRDNYQCVPCKGKGIVCHANTVDHIRPVKDGGSFFHMGNLQSINSSCHAKKSGSERR